jgi:hypothetical protein
MIAYYNGIYMPEHIRITGKSFIYNWKDPGWYKLIRPESNGRPPEKRRKKRGV